MDMSGQGLRIFTSELKHVSVSQESVAAEQKTLSGQVDDLLSWLKDTEAQMDGGMRAEENDHGDQLTQQLNLCKVCVDRDIKS